MLSLLVILVLVRVGRNTYFQKGSVWFPRKIKTKSNQSSAVVNWDIDFFPSMFDSFCLWNESGCVYVWVWMWVCLRVCVCGCEIVYVGVSICSMQKYAKKIFVGKVFLFHFPKSCKLSIPFYLDGLLANYLSSNIYILPFIYPIYYLSISISIACYKQYIPSYLWSLLVKILLSEAEDLVNYWSELVVLFR